MGKKSSMVSYSTTPLTGEQDQPPIWPIGLLYPSQLVLSFSLLPTKGRLRVGDLYIYVKTVKNYDILGRDCRRKKGFRFTTNSADQTSRLMHLSSKDEVVECNEIVTDSVIMSNWWTARFQHASLA